MRKPPLVPVLGDVLSLGDGTNIPVGMVGPLLFAAGAPPSSARDRHPANANANANASATKNITRRMPAV